MQRDNDGTTIHLAALGYCIGNTHAWGRYNTFHFHKAGPQSRGDGAIEGNGPGQLKLYLRRSTPAGRWWSGFARGSVKCVGIHRQLWLKIIW